MSDVLDAAELAPYAACSVVSRSLIKRDTGSATVFSFDKRKRGGYSPRIGR